MRLRSLWEDPTAWHEEGPDSSCHRAYQRAKSMEKLCQRYQNMEGMQVRMPRPTCVKHRVYSWLERAVVLRALGLPERRTYLA